MKAPDDADPYELLASVYDDGWAGFADRYFDFLNAILQNQGCQKGRILDLGCGTGSLAVLLAQSGHTVHGVDGSPAMIRRAREKAQGVAGLEFTVQRLEDLNVGGRFDLVVCTFGTLNYLLTPETVGALLLKVNSLLSAGGAFVFDSCTQALFATHHHGVIERDFASGRIVQELSFDPESRLASSVFRFAGVGVERHRQRSYGFGELQGLLEAAGLKVQGSYGNLRSKPFTEGCERLICVARPAGS